MHNELNEEKNFLIDWTILYYIFASTAKINVVLKNIFSVQKGVLGGWLVNRVLIASLK